MRANFRISSGQQGRLARASCTAKGLEALRQNASKTQGTKLVDSKKREVLAFVQAKTGARQH
jgi:hypothetical protein